MANLRNEERMSLCRKILAHRFNEEQATLEADYRRIGDELYDLIYSAEEQAKMAACAPGAFIEDNHVYVSHGPHRTWIRIDFTRTRLLAYRHKHNRAELPERCTTLVAYELAEAALKEHHKSRDKAEAEIMGLLKSFRTFKQLREGWPEVAQFIPPEPNPQPLVKASESLNKWLKLPPSTKAKKNAPAKAT